ncbi:MAG TPA: DEAD/DEAH box helicase, partial [Thermoanaerobaculia bacterium]
MARREWALSMLRAAYGRPIRTDLLAPHQATAVSRLLAMLEWRRGAILADDVGLGKSYVAAGVARELIARGIDVDIIAPASLVAQWKETLQAFDLDLPIETHDKLARCDGFPGAAPERLIVVDEAHRFRNAATKRYKALALRSIGHRLLLVTATPICNELEDLASLVRLIAADDELALDGVDSLDRAFHEGLRDALAIVLEELVVRRGRKVLGPSLAFGALQRFVVRYPIPDRNGPIADAIDRLEFPLVARPSERRLLRGILWRRLESSDAALLDTLRRQARFYRRARESLRDGFVMTKRDFLRLFGDDDGEPIQQLLFPSCWLSPPTSSSTSMAEVDAELRRIDFLQRFLKRSDAKLAALERQIDDWRGEGTLLFTGSIATALHLYRSLGPTRRAAVMTSKRCAAGDDRRRTREETIDSFRRREVEILISTDVGVEGLNLQRARNVIHYDIPWNPVKLDQRNGRAWRIGQRQPFVRAAYFIPEERSSRAVLAAVASKNRLRRSVLIESASLVDDALDSTGLPSCEGYGSKVAPVAIMLTRVRCRDGVSIRVFAAGGVHW